MGLTSPALLLPLLLLLLCSGFLQVPAARRLRYFGCYCPNKTEINCSKDWSCGDRNKNRWNISDASLHCHSLNSTLVTLFDEDDLAVITALVPVFPSAWLGLTKPENANITWSDGSPFNPNLTTVVNVTGGGPCVARDRGKWKGFNCKDKKAFICSNGTDYYVVYEEKSWCGALRHCRNNSGDLASITNDTQKNELTGMGVNASFWIGLLHHHWHWDQHTCSDVRPPETEDDNKNCSRLSSQESDIILSRSDNVASLICSEGSVRIVVNDEEKSWEEAHAYCRAHHSQLLWLEDERDQRAVEQWLRHRHCRGCSLCCHPDKQPCDCCKCCHCSHCRQCLISCHCPKLKPYWIALRQSRVFGFWFWSGDRFLGQYSNWRNDSVPEPSLSKICGVMEGDTFEWREEECERRLPFLCEDQIFSTQPGSPPPAAPPPPAPALCRPSH